ncbi:MAG: Transcriptional regulator, PadR family [uncultured Rubrobacteraceae bacterium]|uniref:Transcriptional regulator, PadR family n=1 Tax=uncultured Rubrobacteraceae bacterium TaxID=349277 RepID=A0A6J4NCT4_9ACTN|nr:MAG: Transcriptional regulator, PadR family [uncultured Rubrobacteraceae bacterium]
MASKRKVSNPLALAVMALLFERPMHPYEMVSTMRERGKHESVRLRYSSLYSVVEALGRAELVEPVETRREGRRPERTVYGITAAGRAEFLAWLRELLREPAKEYTQFTAGLSFIAALPPQEAAALLRERVRLLEEEVGGMRSRLDEVLEEGLPRLFLVESEHELVLREAELRWVRGLVEEIEAGTLGGMAGWLAFHAQPAAASEEAGEEGDA